VNERPEACPLFTARLVRGAKIGPSPAWLAERLEAVGQRSINNAVDVTNFITFEFGNPCHVFDLRKLAKNAQGRHELRIRSAREGEPLTTLDGRERKLVASDLVVADAERAQSLAGVIGGQDSEVDGSTTDIVLEMATWDPATIRAAARRMQIRTDAGHRFERGVDPRTIEEAAERALALLCELTGGEAAEGVLREGRPLPEDLFVPLRPSRARLVMGIPVEAGEIERLLRPLGIETHAVAEDELRCRVPAHRLDLTREIDLIEEVARIKGLAAVPIAEKLPLRVRPAQPRERAKRELAGALSGLGFWETVTFSFAGEEEAKAFLPEGLRLLAVDEDRRKGARWLRPSVLCGLLGVRRSNQDAGVEQAGGVRLFETAAVFAETPDGRTVERASLGLLLDVDGEGRRRKPEDKQRALRLMRGAIDTLASRLGGAGVRVVPCEAPGGGFAAGAYEPGAVTGLAIDRGDGAGPEAVGIFGLLSGGVQERWGLDVPVVGAELDLEALLAFYPPRTRAQALPQFPHTDRDVSLVVRDEVRWERIDALVRSAALERLESHAFVGTFRGEPIGAGRKSVTLRLRFRDPERTLRAEEVEPAVAAFVDRARRELGAELRG